MPCIGDRKKFPLPLGKSASCPWRAAKRKPVLSVWQFVIFGGVGNEKKLKPFIVSMLFLFAGAATLRKSFSPYNIILSQCLPILKGIPDLLP